MGLEEIGTFVEAAERGSLTAAARALGVPKSTISRRIARLEGELGQALLERSARTFRLTEAGEALYRRSAPAIRDLAEAARLARDAGSEPAGDLRVTLPADLGLSAPFVGFLVAFRDAHPRVRVVTELADRVVDLAAEGFDAAFRLHGGPLEDRASLKVRRLGAFTLGLYASPGYLERAGRPRHPDELAGHACVAAQLGERADRWTLEGEEGAREFPIRAGLVASSMSFLPPAIEAGAGIGIMPSWIAAGLAAAGRVERVLPGWSVPSPTLSLLWPASRGASPRLRAFLDFTAANLRLDGLGGGAREAGGPPPLR